MSFADRVREARIKKGYSQKDLAGKIGVSSKAVSNYENGVSSPNEKIMYALFDALEVDPNFLFQDEYSIAKPLVGTPINMNREIPILGRISAGMPLLAAQNIEGYLKREIHDDEDYFALRVSGDSMNAARINDGDIILVRCQPTVDDGEIAVVLVNGEDATVKRVHKEKNRLTLLPASTNPVHKPQFYDKGDEVRILGRVVENVILF